MGNQISLVVAGKAICQKINWLLQDGLINKKVVWKRGQCLGLM